MKLSKVTQLVWDNRVELNFGSSQIWDQSTFLKDWVDKKLPNLWNNAEGLYWFASDITVSDLCKLQSPSTLPSNGCDFGKQAMVNASLLKGNLCQDFNITVLYNGQHSKVFSRLRSHFHTSDGTGALGLKEFSVSSYQWSAFIFHIDMVSSISGLTCVERDYISNLLRNETGRHSIESVWRSTYGWPILCKK